MLFLFKIVPIPSICPETKCPPNRPFAAIARSKFTLECGLRCEVMSTASFQALHQL